MMVFRILCPLGAKPRLYRFSLKSSSSNIIERINQGPANGSILSVAEFAPTLHAENLSANPDNRMLHLQNTHTDFDFWLCHP